MKVCEAIKACDGLPCTSRAFFTVAGRAACGKHRSAATAFVREVCDGTCKVAVEARLSHQGCAGMMLEILQRGIDRAASQMVETVRWQSWLRGPGRPGYPGRACFELDAFWLLGPLRPFFVKPTLIWNNSSNTHPTWRDPVSPDAA